MSWETIAEELERLRAENARLKADLADARAAVQNLMGVVSETRRVLRSASDMERRAVEGER